MSCTVDVNVLLYASDGASRHQAIARQLLEEKAGGREVFYLSWLTALSYLRIATHPRIFVMPLAPAEALANLRALADRPNVRMIGEGEEFFDLYEEITIRAPSRGNQVPDTQLATLLRQHGIRTLYTNDADFRRFSFLDVRNPFD